MSKNGSKLVKMLKDMGKEEYTDYSNLRVWLDKYLNSDDFEDLMKEDLEED